MKTTKKVYDYSQYLIGDFGEWGGLHFPPHGNAFEDRMKDHDTSQAYRTAQKHRNSDRCPYCAGDLQRIVDTPAATPLSSSSRPEHTVKNCSACGWWFYDYIHWGYIDDFWEWVYYEGILKHFDLSSIEVPVTVLRRHLSKRFDDIRGIHPRKFEELCASIFSDFMHCEVHLTSYSKDHGIDLYAIDGDTQYAIQLKRRTRSVAEGVEPVRAFLGSMLIDGTPRGIFCTTADHFTKDACEDIRSVNLLDYGFSLELVDYHRLSDIFGLVCVNPKEPWTSLLEKHYYRGQT